MTPEVAVCIGSARGHRGGTAGYSAGAAPASDLKKSALIQCARSKSAAGAAEAPGDRPPREPRLAIRRVRRSRPDKTGEAGSGIIAGAFAFPVCSVYKSACGPERDFAPAMTGARRRDFGDGSLSNRSHWATIAFSNEENR